MLSILRRVDISCQHTKKRLHTLMWNIFQSRSAPLTLSTCLLLSAEKSGILKHKKANKHAVLCFASLIVSVGEPETESDNNKSTTGACKIFGSLSHSTTERVVGEGGGGEVVLMNPRYHFVNYFRTRGGDLLPFATKLLLDLNKLKLFSAAIFCILIASCSYLSKSVQPLHISRDYVPEFMSGARGW